MTISILIFPDESFDEDEIRNMRTEALTGSITTYTSGESWSNKGAQEG